MRARRDIVGNLGAEATTLFRALEVAGRVRVYLSGSSMRPLMHAGASAIVVRCSASELLVGDVAVYARGERLLAHVIRRVDACGPVPASLGAKVPEVCLAPRDVLGRLEGLVAGTTCIAWVPRHACRAVVVTFDRLLATLPRWRPAPSP